MTKRIDYQKLNYERKHKGNLQVSEENTGLYRLNSSRGIFCSRCKVAHEGPKDRIWSARLNRHYYMCRQETEKEKLGRLASEAGDRIRSLRKR